MPSAREPPHSLSSLGLRPCRHGYPSRCSSRDVADVAAVAISVDRTAAPPRSVPPNSRSSRLSIRANPVPDGGPPSPAQPERRGGPLGTWLRSYRDGPGRIGRDHPVTPRRVPADSSSAARIGRANQGGSEMAAIEKSMTKAFGLDGEPGGPRQPVGASTPGSRPRWPSLRRSGLTAWLGWPCPCPRRCGLPVARDQPQGVHTCR